MTENSRNMELDGLRAIAVASVVLYHYLFWAAPRPEDGFHYLLWRVAQGGWTGVNLFFVLSGYLITSIIIRNQNSPNFSRVFYIRRALKILPPLWLAIAVVCLVYDHVSSYLVASLLMVPNLAPILGIPVPYPVFWSLGVEEHFYLVWPWVVRSVSVSKLVMISLAICCITPFIRGFGYSHGLGENTYSWYRMDSLAWGCLVAALRSKFPSIRQSRAVLRRLAFAFSSAGLLILVGGLRFAITTRTSLVGAMLQFTFIDLECVALLCITLSFEGTRLISPLRAKFVQLIGTRSYGIYLYHLAMLTLVDRFAGALFSHLGNGPLYVGVRTFLSLTATLVFSELSFRFLESPILNFKSRVPYSQPLESLPEVTTQAA